MVRMDGRAYGHVITKISRMDGLPDFLRYGAPLVHAWSRIFGCGFFCRDETQCVGNVHNVSSTRVAEFDLRRTSMVDVKLVLSHFDFHLSTIFITLRSNCDISM